MTETLSVLIVEDEPLIAMMLEDFIDELGHCVVGTADCLTDALAHVEKGGFDLAILDIHLQGQDCWPIADSLADRGIAFVLATGGHIEPPPLRHAAARVLTKPFAIDGVKTLLNGVVAAG